MQVNSIQSISSVSTAAALLRVMQVEITVMSFKAETLISQVGQGMDHQVHEA